MYVDQGVRVIGCVHANVGVCSQAAQEAEAARQAQELSKLRLDVDDDGAH